MRLLRFVPDAVAMPVVAALMFAQLVALHVLSVRLERHRRGGFAA